MRKKYEVWATRDSKDLQLDSYETLTKAFEYIENLEGAVKGRTAFLIRNADTGMYLVWNEVPTLLNNFY
jgi:hypothetical protein